MSKMRKDRLVIGYKLIWDGKDLKDVPIYERRKVLLKDIETKVCPGCGKTLYRENYTPSKWVKKVCCDLSCFRAYQKTQKTHPWRVWNVKGGDKK